MYRTFEIFTVFRFCSVIVISTKQSPEHLDEAEEEQSGKYHTDDVRISMTSFPLIRM